MSKPWWVYDIEADNLLEDVTVVHCAVLHDLKSGDQFAFGPDKIEVFMEMLGKAELIFAHNGISYDLPVLKKIHPEAYDKFLAKWEAQIGVTNLDTLVMCRLNWPDIMSMDQELVAAGRITLPDEPDARKKFYGSHSLRAWGYRLGFLKGNASGEVTFDKFTPEMLEYCKRDVLLNVRLAEKLIEQLGIDGPVSEYTPVWIEHKFAAYLDKQMEYGVQFDKEKCEWLVEKLEKVLDKQLLRMQTTVPDILLETTMTPKVSNKRYGYEAGVPVTKRKTIPFNPRSQDHVRQFLMNKYDWKPSQFTKPSKRHPSGQPEVSFEVLNKLDRTRFPEAALLANIRLLMDRLGLLKNDKQSWLNCVKPTGRIHGYINHNGTNTHRCRHSAPNLGNIVSAKSPMGHLCRSLFVARPGFKLMGADAASLETRALGEALWDYDGGGAAFELLVFGSKEEGTDVHSRSRDAVRAVVTKMGYPQYAATFSRDDGKTDFYAILYGAGDKKAADPVFKGAPVGDQVKFRVGKAVKAAILDGIPGMPVLLAGLLRDFQTQMDKKQWPHLRTIDGRRVPIRKKSALLNTLLQSIGAVYMKLVSVLIWIRAEEAGLVMGRDWFPVLHVHDEVQLEVRDDDNGKTIGVLTSVVDKCFREAGELLAFRVPMLGSIDVGDNWAETH